MNERKHQLGETQFAFFEGSEVIASVTTGGLHAFKKLDEPEKAECRKRATQKIKSTCSGTSKVGIVTGHLSFWDEERCDRPMKACTQDDLDTFTHILYLNTPLYIITKLRANDTERLRPSALESRLRGWQRYEIKELSCLCMKNNIIFGHLWPNLRHKLSTFIRDAIRVIIVAGVVQDQALKGGSSIRAVARFMEHWKRNYRHRQSFFNTTQLD
ncbi:hypothetical protein ABHI18_003537 [Aspergillus niger]